MPPTRSSPGNSGRLEPARAPPPAAEATAAAPRPFPRLVHGEGPATELVTVERADCAVGIVTARHLHEPEAAGAAGVAVRDELDLADLAAVLREQIADLVLIGAEGQIADIQSRSHTPKLLSLPRREPLTVLVPDPSRRNGLRAWARLLAPAHHTSFLYERMRPGLMHTIGDRGKSVKGRPGPAALATPWLPRNPRRP